MTDGLGGGGVDLSTRAISAFLQEIGGAEAEQIRRIEDAETWTCDHDPEVIGEIERFWSGLEEEQLHRLASCPDRALITLLGYIRAARNLILLDHLTKVRDDADGISGHVLSEMRRAARGDLDASQAFEVCLSRLAHLERSRMLRRIYGYRRAQMIIDALREVT